jgi:hypothetical protein
MRRRRVGLAADGHRARSPGGAPCAGCGRRSRRGWRPGSVEAHAAGTQAGLGASARRPVCLPALRGRAPRPRRLRRLRCTSEAALCRRARAIRPWWRPPPPARSAGCSASACASAASSAWASACTSCTRRRRRASRESTRAPVTASRAPRPVAHALDQERPDLRRQQAEPGLGQAEDHGVVGQRHVAHAGQAEATAHHRALQHRHERQPGLREGHAQLAEGGVDARHRIGVLGQALARRRHVADVAAGAEVAAGAAQHDDARRAVGLGLRPAPRAAPAPWPATSHCAPRGGSA